MAVTITRSDVRAEMLRRAPVLGRRLTADSLTKAGPSLTDVSEYERQRSGLTAFEGQYINRYLQPDPDNWRLITSLNSGANDGVVNVDGPAYANVVDLAYERLTVHPDDLNFAIQEGQRRQRTRTNIALVRGHDMDMQSAGVLYWGTSGGSVAVNATPTKTTSDVFSGTQSLLYTATGAGNSIRSEVFGVMPGRQIYAALIVRVLTPPFIFKLYDATNGVYFGDTRTLSLQYNGGAGGGGWCVCFIQAQVPSNCSVIQYEFSSTSAVGLFEVDTCFGPYQAGQTEYPLQAAIDEAYKLRFVRPSRFIYPLQTEGFFDAESIEYIGDLIHPQDWDMEVFRRDVNSNRLRFIANSYNNNSIGWGLPSNAAFMSQNMGPIWLAWEAQVSDFEPLLTEAATTSQPLDECACYSLRYLAETEFQRDPTNPVWANMLQEYKAWSVVEDQGRPPQAMYKPQRFHQIRA